MQADHVLTTRIIPSLAEVSADAWNALVGGDDPFTEHGFLKLLEDSRSVGPGTGWRPCHVLAERAGKLVGAMPLYLKHHSFGEFIFDFGWANAAMRAGLPYYPKLVSAVPFTPATGSRLLTRPEETERSAIVRALVEEALSLTDRARASSLHVLFGTPQEQEELAHVGLHPRLSHQFHWENQGFSCFDDFLGALRNSSRKQVRRERQRAQAAGLALGMRPARALSAPDMEALWSFYQATIEDKGSTCYLTRAFFEGLASLESAYVAMAHDGEHPVAGALFFFKGRSLYGRYWGQAREVPMLHFELCYYLPMEWGLARGMQRFEAGAQGEHKIKRGFLPARCYSAHRMLHPGLDRAVLEFVREEARGVLADIEVLSQSTPFRRA
jgi:hypothetical protein